jgi:flagellar hook-basal body complex protein FliE
MSIPIAPITSIRVPEAVQPVTQSGPGGGVFKSMLDAAIQHVETNSSQTNAGQSVDKFLSGESEELHSTALAVQRAELEFELFLQVRNKVVQAYQEIMRMQM